MILKIMESFRIRLLMCSWKYLEQTKMLGEKKNEMMKKKKHKRIYLFELDIQSMYRIWKFIMKKFEIYLVKIEIEVQK